MKLGALLLGAVSAWSGVKEHVMIEQYLRTGEVNLVDEDRSNGKRQWHDCGDKPKQPENAQSVECQGPFCATVCKQGYRSMGNWRTKCIKKKKQFAFDSKLTACQTCKSYLNKVHSSVQHQKTFYKNLPVHEFFCGRSSEVLHFGGDTFKNGKHKKVKCRCKRQAAKNKDKTAKKQKFCKWVAEGETFRDTDFGEIKCSKEE